MPNESVKCSNCGSGDVQQLAADSYKCEHCQTDFHWVNPTKRNTVSKPNVCSCGKVAVAYCRRCEEPLCEIHEIRWGEWPRQPGDNDNSSLPVGYRARLCLLRRHPEWVRQPLQERDLPRIDERCILCVKCAVECITAYESIVEQLRPAAQAAREEASPFPAAPPIMPTTQKTSPESPLLGRLWDWLRGFGK